MNKKRTHFVNPVTKTVILLLNLYFFGNIRQFTFIFKEPSLSCFINKPKTNLRNKVTTIVRIHQRILPKKSGIESSIIDKLWEANVINVVAIIN